MRPADPAWDRDHVDSGWSWTSALAGFVLVVLGLVIGAMTAAPSTDLGRPSLARAYEPAYSYDLVGHTATATTALRPFEVAKTSATAPLVMDVGDDSSWHHAGVAAEEASPGTALVKYSYPPNRGFMGSAVRTTLKPGTVLDRYGADSGTFVSPQGTPFGARSLPPASLDKPFNTYEVVNPIDVHAGTDAPWFGQGGGGIQYEFGQSIADLIESGFLKAVGR